jgi:hypothetical protein
MKRRRITAGELMAQLESDLEYVKRRALRDARTSVLEQECRTDEALLVRKVRAIGYDIDSVWDLVNNAPHPHLSRRFVVPYSGAYSTLLKHLEQPHHPRTREGIVRALTVKDGGPQVEEALLSAFRKDRRSFKRGVFPGKRAQNQALWWAENGSYWERIVNADLAGGSTAAAKLRNLTELLGQAALTALDGSPIVERPACSPSS